MTGNGRGGYRGYIVFIIFMLNLGWTQINTFFLPNTIFLAGLPEKITLMKTDIIFQKKNK